MYPILDDLLDDWKADYRAPYGGIRVVGNRWSSDSHRVKDFLARNHVPYQWQDIEADGEACSLYEGADAPDPAPGHLHGRRETFQPGQRGPGREGRAEDDGRAAVL